MFSMLVDARRGYYKETGRDLGILRRFQSTEVFPLVEEERNIKHDDARRGNDKEIGRNLCILIGFRRAINRTYNRNPVTKSSLSNETSFLAKNMGSLCMMYALRRTFTMDYMSRRSDFKQHFHFLETMLDDFKRELRNTCSQEDRRRDHSHSHHRLSSPSKVVVEREIRKKSSLSSSSSPRRLSNDERKKNIVKSSSPSSSSSPRRLSTDEQKKKIIKSEAKKVKTTTTTTTSSKKDKEHQRIPVYFCIRKVCQTTTGGEEFSDIRPPTPPYGLKEDCFCYYDEENPFYISTQSMYYPPEDISTPTQKPPVVVSESIATQEDLFEEPIKCKDEDENDSNSSSDSDSHSDSSSSSSSATNFEEEEDSKKEEEDEEATTEKQHASSSTDSEEEEDSTKEEEDEEATTEKQHASSATDSEEEEDSTKEEEDEEATTEKQHASSSTDSEEEEDSKKEEEDEEATTEKQHASSSTDSEEEEDSKKEEDDEEATTEKQHDVLDIEAGHDDIMGMDEEFFSTPVACDTPPSKKRSVEAAEEEELKFKSKLSRPEMRPPIVVAAPTTPPPIKKRSMEAAEKVELQIKRKCCRPQMRPPPSKHRWRQRPPVLKVSLRRLDLFDIDFWTSRGRDDDDDDNEYDDDEEDDDTTMGVVSGIKKVFEAAVERNRNLLMAATEKQAPRPLAVQPPPQPLAIQPPPQPLAHLRVDTPPPLPPPEEPPPSPTRPIMQQQEYYYFSDAGYETGEYVTYYEPKEEADMINAPISSPEEDPSDREYEPGGEGHYFPPEEVIINVQSRSSRCAAQAAAIAIAVMGS
ncbi:hypothetical protein Pcinc_002321 [Petrolisthes cinctipes]|uniref:Uncharacterized protein n=1 Tax=Petrolisthes cinctipes TaxID=88211 RepID=A0AAE1GJ03_PETCI|nr:hypothetical protein Pcinc_002321 [Petrolisthes cinctipes]